MPAKALNKRFDRREKEIAIGDIKSKAIISENQVIPTTGMRKYKKDELNIHLHKPDISTVCQTKVRV